MPNELSTVPSEAPAAVAGESILDAFIIDDDPLMAELIARTLAKLGVDTIRFEEPERLLYELSRRAPALLITDLEMPRMDGVSLIRQARLGGYRGTVTLVTASRCRERIVAAVDTGADEVLAKPLREPDAEILVAKARARLARTRARRDALAEVVEAVDQGIVLLDDSATPVYANEKARTLLAAESVEDVSRVISRACPAEVLERGRDGSGAAIFVDVASREGEGTSPVGLEVVELREPLGGAHRLILLHDFSEWRKLDELHGRFATYLSHRMRTPLTSARNAVRILKEKSEPLDGAEKEKFLDIGSRNIDQLIRSFDELQKMFMIESGEINACRTLAPVGEEVASRLAELEKSGVVTGFKVSAPGLAIPTGRGELADFVTHAVETIASWLGAAPAVECVVSAREGREAPAAEDDPVTITLKPRGVSGERPVSLHEFLSAAESHRRAILDRLASALGGVCEVAARDAVRLSIPADPPFSRDRDLVHPLHLMIERSELERGEFHMASVRLVGAVRAECRFKRLFAATLCAIFSADGCVVSKGEEPLSYSVFIAGMPHERVVEMLERLQRRFMLACQELGEELYPSIRFEIAYHHSPGDAAQPNVLSQLEGIL
jgi:DNA-binding response OmpR family regulator